MLTALESWNGKIVIDDTEYNSIKNIPNKAIYKGVHIKLYPNREKSTVSSVNSVEKEYKITVKRYMTEKATPQFDFMAQWNNDNPMPLVTMTGKKIKETKGMVYMELHGQAEPTITCMRCGKQLTNIISQKYGIGPECRSKIPILMDIDIDDVDTMQKKLVDVTWVGWIIKSAIVEKVEV